MGTGLYNIMFVIHGTDNMYMVYSLADSMTAAVNRARSMLYSEGVDLSTLAIRNSKLIASIDQNLFNNTMNNIERFADI